VKKVGTLELPQTDEEVKTAYEEAIVLIRNLKAVLPNKAHKRQIPVVFWENIVALSPYMAHFDRATAEANSALAGYVMGWMQCERRD